MAKANPESGTENTESLEVTADHEYFYPDTGVVIVAATKRGGR